MIDDQIQELVRERNKLNLSLRSYTMLLSSLESISIFNRENMDNDMIKCFSLKYPGL